MADRTHSVNHFIIDDNADAVAAFRCEYLLSILTRTGTQITKLSRICRLSFVVCRRQRCCAVRMS